MSDAEKLFGDDPVLTSGYDYWLASRRGGDAPPVSTIDPTRLPPILFPHLVLAEYLQDTRVIKYRLVGQAMVDRWGENFAGKTSTEIFSGSYRTFLEDNFELARSSRQPVFSESVFRWDQGGSSLTKRLTMPFADDDTKEIIRAIVIQVWPGKPGSPEERYMDIVENPAKGDHTAPRLVSPARGGKSSSED